MRTPPACLLICLMLCGTGAFVQSTPENLKSSIRFEPHILDQKLYALGADLGDRNSEGPADVVASGLVALDRSKIFWYSNGKKHLIDEFTTPTLFIHLRTADFDRDGDVDAVAADHRNGNIVYYENPGRGPAKTKPWPKHLVDDGAVGAHAVAIGDINDDGRIDIVASGEKEATPPESVYWYACPEKPNEVERWSKYILGPGQGGGLAHYPAIGDVNGDGKPDVVHAAKSPEGGEWYRLWLQPKDPTQPWTLRQVGKGYAQATNVQVADVNRDGKADLIATQGHHMGLLWFEGPDMNPRYVDQTLRSPHSLAVADIDGDEDIDFATCAYESKVLAWFENDGRGEFARHDISTNQEAYDLVARDVDNDSDLDLIVAGRGSENVVWYEQTGKPAKAKVKSR
jgi:FG-GAP-like repeat